MTARKTDPDILEAFDRMRAELAAKGIRVNAADWQDDLPDRLSQEAQRVVEMARGEQAAVQLPHGFETFSTDPEVVERLRMHFAESAARYLRMLAALPAPAKEDT